MFFYSVLVVKLKVLVIITSKLRCRYVISFLIRVALCLVADTIHTFTVVPPT